MTDDSKKTALDRKLISLEEDYEVRDWTKSLGCPQRRPYAADIAPNLLKAVEAEIALGCTGPASKILQVKMRFPHGTAKVELGSPRLQEMQSGRRAERFRRVRPQDARSGKDPRDHILFAGFAGVQGPTRRRTAVSR